MEQTTEIEPDAAVRAALPGHVSLLFSWSNEIRARSLREGESLVVGRALLAQLVLDDSSLSRAHARLSLLGGRVILEDLGSTNGCVINGERAVRAELADGDVAQLGVVELRVSGPLKPGLRSLLVSHARFLQFLEDELTRARLFNRSFALLAIRHSDSEALRAALLMALKPLGRWCHFAGSVVLVLLPEHDVTRAKAWCEALRVPGGQQARIGVAPYPAVMGSVEELTACALDGCHRAPPGGIQVAGSGSCDARDARDELALHAPIVLSPCMSRLYAFAARAARSTLPVLVQGETGSGKELVARAVHDASQRGKAPFKTLNCGAIPVHLVESVLFGHERGAFTGADRQVSGLFEQAQGGTLFLDEVGELPLPAQVALLRVLEQRRIVRVGGSREIEVDARVVAATHRDLRAMVEAQTFREDLMFRLDALTLRVPPLRERKEEILPLAHLFLARARTQWGASATRISDSAAEALLSFRFPGNVRQLRNVIERAIVVCSGETIDLEDLPDEVWVEDDETSLEDGALCGEASARIQDGEPPRSLPLRVREFEVAIIRDVLNQAHWNQSQAARLLGVPRRTLASKIQVYGLTCEQDAAHAQPSGPARSRAARGISRT